MASSTSSARPPRPPTASQPLQPLDIDGDGTVASSRTGVSAVTASGTPFLCGRADDDFELMHVKVTVLGLTGIISETIASKKQKPSSSKIKSNATRTPMAEDQSSNARKTNVSTVSSLSSTDASTGSDPPVNERVPTMAIVAFQRNVTNSETVIATHLPSNALGPPASSFGTINRYVATWPSDCNSFVQYQDGDVDRSSFTLLRVMMRDPMENIGNSITSSSRAATSSSRAAYATETIDIHIGVCRGKDIIPLGIASLVITGDEEGAELMVLPAKPLDPKGKKSVLGGELKKRRPRRIFNKSTKKASFPDDPTRSFKLDENASLRVVVKVLPSYAFNAVADPKTPMPVEKVPKTRDEAPDDSENEENEKPTTNQGKKAEGRKLVTCSLAVPATPTTNNEDTEKKVQVSIFDRGIFCGCSPLGASLENQAKSKNDVKGLVAPASRNDFFVDDSTMDSFARQFGSSFQSSSVSSVSESQSDTDNEDPETVHINRKIVVKKKRSLVEESNNRDIQSARATLRKQAQRLGVKPKDLL